MTGDFLLLNMTKNVRPLVKKIQTKHSQVLKAPKAWTLLYPKHRVCLKTQYESSDPSSFECVHLKQTTLIDPETVFSLSGWKNKQNKTVN